MKTITLIIINASGIEKKIAKKESFMILFTKNTFHYFKVVQNIFFKKNIGWAESGRSFLNLELRKDYFVLFYDGECLTFEDLDSYELADYEDDFEEYIFSPINKRKKLSI